MRRLLVDDAFRGKMLKMVDDPSVRQFWQYYDNLPALERRQSIGTLVNRLESLFMGRSLVRNILGQRETSIDFRSSIENKEIIIIRLPLKTLAQDAKLIGMLIVAQLHAAIFSFADLPEDKHPGSSLYIDEFQHFATPDFAEMFTEGRKFGVRVCLAHQYRGQLPTYLQQSTMTARTKVCFQTTPDDSREMAHFYLHGQPSIKPEDIEPKVVEHLLHYGSADPNVQTFINCYLRPLQSQKRSGQIEIQHPGTRWEHLPYWMLSVEAPKDNPLGKRTTQSVTDVAHMLTQPPKRAAFVRSGDDVGVIYTENTLPPCDDSELRRRSYLIRGQTRQKYCVPRESLNDGTPPPIDNEPPTSHWEEV